MKNFLLDKMVLGFMFGAVFTITASQVTLTWLTVPVFLATGHIGFALIRKFGK